MNQTPQSQLLLASARRHRQAGEHLHAFAELIRAITSQPLSAELAREVVAYGRAAGTSVAATAALEDSLESCEPQGRPTIERLLARSLRRLSRLAKARVYLYEMLGADVGDVRIVLELARVLYVEGRHDELVELLRSQVVSREPRHRLGFRTALVRGHLLLQELGDPLAASQAFASAAQVPGLLPMELALASSLAAVCGRWQSNPDETSARISRRLRDAADEAIAGLSLGPIQGPQGSAEAFLQWVPKALPQASHRTELWVVREVLLKLKPTDGSLSELVQRLRDARCWAELASLYVRTAERSSNSTEGAQHLVQAAEIRAEHLGDVELSADLYRRAFMVDGQMESLDRAVTQLDGLGKARADQLLDLMVSQVVTVEQKSACLALRARRRFRSHLYLEASSDLDRLASLRPLEPFERALLLSSRAELGDHDALHQLSREVAATSMPDGERVNLTSRVRRLSSWLCPEAHGPEGMPSLVFEASSDPGPAPPGDASEAEPAPGRSLERKRPSVELPKELLEELDQHPLRAAVHRRLADVLDEAGSILSASIHREVARAIDGDPFAHPLAPRNTLTPVEVAALKHPALNGDLHEMLSLCGEVLCAMASSGPSRGLLFDGARPKAVPAAQALLATVRILGMPAPPLYAASSAGPPFGAANTDPLSLQVGRIASSGRLSEAELRFYAGRALYSSSPGYAPLRLLSADQLNGALTALMQVVLYPRKAAGAHAEMIAERLSEKAQARILEIAETLNELPTDWSPFITAARHSANRAGLVVAGGVAAAVDALRAKGARREEVGELVKFAVSSRYLRIRERR